VNQERKNIAFIFPFEKLEVWQDAVELADYIFKLMSSLPSNKNYRLINQMEGAVSSVAQNIAEGKGRQYKREFIQYLYIAEGSLFEVLTLTEILRRNELIATSEAQIIRSKAEMIDRKLHGLINSLKQRTFSK
jgi:four helix bundle protein